MNFLRTLRDSVWSPSFYRTLRGRPIAQSVTYFLFLSLLLGVLFAIPAAPGLFSSLSKQTVEMFVDHTYPADLVITVENGIAHSNKAEPYYVPITSSGSGSKNLLVIDTVSPFTVAQLKSYSTVLLLKKDSIVAESSQGIRIVPLTNITHFILDKALVAHYESKILPFVFILPLFVSLLLWVAFSAVYFFVLLYLFFAAAILWLLDLALRWRLGYKVWYKVALHAATLPMILGAVLSATHIGLPRFSFTLILLLIALVNARGLKTPSGMLT